MLNRLDYDESVDQLNLNFSSECACIDEEQMEQIRAATMQFRLNNKRKKRKRTIQIKSYLNDIKLALTHNNHSSYENNDIEFVTPISNNENNTNKVEYYNYKDSHCTDIYKAYCKIGRGEFYQLLSGYDPLINIGCLYDPNISYGPILHEKIKLYQKENRILKLR